MANGEKAIYTQFEEFLKQKSCEQICFFKNQFITKNLDICLSKNSAFSELNFGHEFRGDITIKEKLNELDELLNYDYKRVVERLQQKKEKYPNLMAEKNFSACLKQIDFDALHKDGINNIDICPNSKL